MRKSLNFTIFRQVIILFFLNFSLSSLSFLIILLRILILQLLLLFYNSESGLQNSSTVLTHFLKATVHFQFSRPIHNHQVQNNNEASLIREPANTNIPKVLPVCCGYSRLSFYPVSLWLNKALPMESDVSLGQNPFTSCLAPSSPN